MIKHPKEADRLKKIVEAFPKITVTVLGDLVADEFVFGEISRVSREAPVLILKHRERTVVPGGAANAANNLADLGVNVLPVGIVGDDEPGRMLLKYFRHKRIAVSGVLKDKSYTTVTKTRILAGMTHTARQQVVRVDREPQDAPNAHLTRELYLAARNYAHASDALLVSDYGYGAATPAIVNTLREKGKVGSGADRRRFALPADAVFWRNRGDAQRTRSGRGARRSHRAGLEQSGRRGRTGDGAHEAAVAGDHARARRHGGFRSQAQAGGHSDFRFRPGGRCDGRGRHGDRGVHGCARRGRDNGRSGATGQLRRRDRGDEARHGDRFAAKSCCMRIEQTPPATRPH